MFPDKNRMVRQANILLVMLGISPAVYIVIATLVVFGRPGLARNPEIILPILFGADSRLRCEHWRPRFYPNQPKIP